MEQDNLTPIERERERVFARAREFKRAIESNADVIKELLIIEKAQKDIEARDRRKQHKYAVKHSNRK
jgi:hypothetical protein